MRRIVTEVAQSRRTAGRSHDIPRSAVTMEPLRRTVCRKLHRLWCAPTTRKLYFQQITSWKHWHYC